MPLSVETRGNETYYKNGCLIWNHRHGLSGVLKLYYERYDIPIDSYYLDRIRKRDEQSHNQNRKNFEKRVKEKFQRKKSFEANQRKDRNDELCYRPEPAEFLRKLSLEEKFDWAENEHSKKRDKKKPKSDSQNGPKNKFSQINCENF